jgi:peptidoglycan hydrolase-like protein with peptidoglycan-binding domain
VDGDFGPLTKAAVEAFQSSRGLGVDGRVGLQTWPQLIIQVQRGSNGDAVRAVQSQIHSRGDGTAQITIDGIFGPVTNDNVRAFQTLLGLSVDGIVGPQTWNHSSQRLSRRPRPADRRQGPVQRLAGPQSRSGRQECHPGGGEPDLRPDLLIGRRLVVRGLPGRRRRRLLQLAGSAPTAAS